MKNLKKQLKEGKIIHFDNENFCSENNLSENYFRDGSIEIRECWGRLEFITWFNGVINHSSKTWKSSEKNMNRLFSKWNCNITDINEEI